MSADVFLILYIDIYIYNIDSTCPMCHCEIKSMAVWYMMNPKLSFVLFLLSLNFRNVWFSFQWSIQQPRKPLILHFSKQKSCFPGRPSTNRSQNDQIKTRMKQKEMKHNHRDIKCHSRDTRTTKKRFVSITKRHLS